MSSLPARDTGIRRLISYKVHPLANAHLAKQQRFYACTVLLLYEYKSNLIRRTQPYFYDITSRAQSIYVHSTAVTITTEPSHHRVNKNVFATQ